jgi:protein-S-isoprenylcysteine O-methyltransferase Ste14
MEAPSPILMTFLFLAGDRRTSLPALVFLALWLLHYVNRAFVFPLRLRGRHKPMPLLVALLAFHFNLVNGYLNGRGLFSFGPERGPDWLADPRFLAGTALFLAGFAINLHADAVLRALRAPGETGYKIPRGGLYRLISCPNYFGEIVEWIGFALATWSLPALTFAVWTIANLLPRSVANHRWYRERFPDYPPERRALLPFVL